MEDWVSSSIGAMTEVATGVLGYADVRHVGTTTGVVHSEAGAYLALLGDETVEIGLVSDVATCASAARALLGMTPEDELSDSDMADACCEIVNIASGLVKRTPALEGMKTGLPLFVTGHASFPETAEASTVELECDGLKFWFVVVRMPGSAAPRAHERAKSVCPTCHQLAH